MTDAVLNVDAPFHRIVENIVDYAIFTLNVEGGVTSWNTGAERIKQYRPDEIIGHHFSTFYPPEDIAAGKPEHELKLARDEGRFEDEGWRLRRDGSRFWANVIITALRDEQGKLHGFVKLTRDLTERRQEELEARRGREIFHRIVEAAPNALVMVDDGGKIVMVNAQAERVFGYDRRDLLEQSIERLIPLRFRDHHLDLRNTFLGDPQSRPMGAGRELYGLRKDGSEFPVEIGLNLIKTEDETLILSSIIDISDRKQKEASIEAALAEKNILLAEIHHRVKNNLQIIHSLLDLQGARLSDQSAINALKESQSRIRSMALIHQVLYQSKDFAGVDFSTVLQSLVSSLVQSYRVSEARIEVELATDQVFLPLNVAIPCGLVINELTTNTIKHAFPDGWHGKLRIELKQTDDKLVSLRIEDDGIGIPDTLDLESTETLGLQLVRLLVNQVHGTLEIHRSAPTAFLITFRLPGNPPT